MKLPKSGLVFSTALITILYATTAQAGFQWNPPAQSVAVQPESKVVMPENVTSGPLMPMPSDVTPPPAKAGMKTISQTSPQPIVPEASVPENIESDVMPAPAPQTAPQELESVPEQTPASPQKQMDTASTIVEGFGKDIPLAIALRQIVPPQYAYSFASGVDQGKPVSWTGGKIWSDVLNDMLASRQLRAEVSGNVVSITPSMSPSTASAEVPPMPVEDSQTQSSAPVIDMMMSRHWEAKQGQSLQEVLKNWSTQANVQLEWKNKNDMPISSTFNYDGTFDQAVDALLSLYTHTPNEPVAKLYPNLPEGPSVLLIGENS